MINMPTGGGGPSKPPPLTPPLTPPPLMGDCVGAAPVAYISHWALSSKGYCFAGHLMSLASPMSRPQERELYQI